MAKKESELVDIFKEHNLDKIIFTFDCGGDSMNDTSCDCIKDGKSYDNEKLYLGDFEDYIYQNVEFYESSDGEYLGEFGTVEITLEGDELFLSKTSTSRISEEYKERITLKEKKYSYIFEYVECISYRYGDIEIDYKKDFVVPENFDQDIEKLIKHIDNLDELEDLCDSAEGINYDITYGGSTKEIIVNLSYFKEIHVNE